MTVLGRDRSVPHMRRKLYHLVMGLVCFSLYAFLLTREQAILTLLVVGGVWVVCDALRLRYPSVNNLALQVFGPLMRREELRSLSANTFYIAGLLTITILFPKPIVLMSVLFLAVGDPTAAVVGTLFGRRRLVGEKSVEGSAANFVVCAIVTLVFALAYLLLPLPGAIALALVGGIVSALAELCPLPVNDNFTIPVISASLLQIAAIAVPF